MSTIPRSPPHQDPHQSRSGSQGPPDSCSYSRTGEQPTTNQEFGATRAPRGRHAPRSRQPPTVESKAGGTSSAKEDNVQEKWRSQASVVKMSQPGSSTDRKFKEAQHLDKDKNQHHRDMDTPRL